MKKRVLFICIHNSARSQIAEAWMNYTCGDLRSGKRRPRAGHAQSAGRTGDAGGRNRHFEKGTQEVFDVFKSGRLFTYVVTVCDESSAEKCPIFPGPAQRLHWSFPDPSQLTGTPEEKLSKAREIRDEIRSKVEEWCEQVCPQTVVA